MIWKNTTTRKIEQNAETLTEELVSSKKEVRKLKEAQQETEYTAKEAIRLGNHNQQYSRKHNFKVMEVNEQDKENSWKLVQDFQQSSINVGLDVRENCCCGHKPWDKGKTSTHHQSCLYDHKSASNENKVRDQTKRKWTETSRLTRPITDLIIAILKHLRDTSMDPYLES